MQILAQKWWGRHLHMRPLGQNLEDPSPASLLYIPMIFWQQFRGSWYNLGHYSYQFPWMRFFERQKHLPPNFMMEHLLQGLYMYGVDAPVYWEAYNAPQSPNCKGGGMLWKVLWPSHDAWVKWGVESGDGALLDSRGKEFNAPLSQLKQFPKQIIENFSVNIVWSDTQACVNST